MANTQFLDQARLALATALTHVEASLESSVHHPECDSQGELDFSARLTDLLDDLDRLITAKSAASQI